jgi:hypothetical protein
VPNTRNCRRKRDAVYSATAGVAHLQPRDGLAFHAHGSQQLPADGVRRERVCRTRWSTPVDRHYLPVGRPLADVLSMSTSWSWLPRVAAAATRGRSARCFPVPSEAAFACRGRRPAAGAPLATRAARSADPRAVPTGRSRWGRSSTAGRGCCRRWHRLGAYYGLVAHDSGPKNSRAVVIVDHGKTADRAAVWRMRGEIGRRLVKLQVT